MSSATPSIPLRSYVLAAHPTARGFGWIIFENPTTPLDWGIAFAKPGRLAPLKTRFERIINRYQPATLVLEEHRRESGDRATRVQAVTRSLEQLAQSLGMRVAIFGHDVVRHYFARYSASSRYEIAQVIASRIEGLAWKLPRRRRIWESENPRQSIFDAAALVLTFYAVHGEMD